MYIQKTKYYCSKCKTHDHWANEVCGVGSSTVEQGRFQAETARSPMGLEVDPGIGSTPVQPAIKKAKEFIKKVKAGSFDRAKYQREYMRKYRASKREKVLGDGQGPVEIKSGSE